jgi:NAD(P)-dependent dehydrogenase (short-subunit alcohol dehydrogenase family)
MNAVVTGAGSGVGQATALALASLGWRVAILGRAAAKLEDTLRLAGERAGQLQAHSCDIGDERAVAETGRAILAEFGTVELLVNAAGTNAPRRALAVLSSEDYHAMIAANLHGAYYCTQAFLPGMRERGTGTIVNIISDAAKQASPKAGPAYSMSKAGMVGLTQAINAEERANGVRACAILPGGHRYAAARQAARAARCGGAGEDDARGGHRRVRAVLRADAAARDRGGVTHSPALSAQGSEGRAPARPAH